jgi:hypothetical protein
VFSADFNLATLNQGVNMRHTTKWFLGLTLLLLLSALPLMAIQAQETNQRLTATPSPTLVPSPTLPFAGGDDDDDDDGDTTTLEYGESVDGELTLEDPTVTYEFEGEAGDNVTIVMTGPFDTYLVLTDDSGYELTYDDDSNGNLNSRISVYTLPSDGTYLIIAQSFSYRTGGSGVEGEYTVSLSLTVVRDIEYTQEVEGELTSAEPATLFRFNGDAGDLVAVTVSSDSFAPYITLADSSNYEFAYSDYYNSGRVATLGPTSLPYDGEYTIAVMSNSGTPTSGNFTLVVDRIELTEVEFDEPVEVELTSGLPAYFSFEAETGELINISVDSDNTIDTRLDILDPSGYSIYTDDDSGAGFDPEVNRLVVSSTGTYTVVIRPFADSGEGTVTMTVTRAPVPNLDEGPQVVELGDKQQNAVLTFEAEAGEEYTIVFEDMGSAQPYITISQDGYTLTTISTGPVSGLSVTVVATSDGPVQIQIQDYSYTNVSMTVSLGE